MPSTSLDGWLHWFSIWFYTFVFMICLQIETLNGNRAGSVMVDCAIRQSEWERERERGVERRGREHHKPHFHISTFTSASTAPRDSHYLQFWLFTCFPFPILRVSHKVSVGFPRRKTMVCKVKRLYDLWLQKYVVIIATDIDRFP